MQPRPSEALRRVTLSEPVMVSAILLAAGKSERMGAPKQLLRLGSLTFVERCVDSLLNSPAGEVIVVTGHHAAAVRGVLANRPVQLAYNPRYRLGMATSIIRGFQSISASSVAVMVALVDQPLISSEVISHIIGEYKRARPLIAIPSYRGRRGHPIIIGRQLEAEVLSMDVTVGLRQVIATHAADIRYVEVDADSIVLDCDYPEDYSRLIERSE